MFKATYQNASRGSIALTVAVKALKTSNGSARESLLKEAALMALLEHPNIVAMVGLVTAPRNMPALLVLEFCESKYTSHTLDCEL